MNIITSFLLLLILAPSLLAQGGIVGHWNTGKENTVVNIHVKDGAMVGEIVSSDNPKAEAGKQLVKDLRQDGGKWKGRLFAPMRQQWFDALFKPAGNKLEISVNAGIMSKETHWKRVKLAKPE